MIPTPSKPAFHSASLIAVALGAAVVGAIGGWWARALPDATTAPADPCPESAPSLDMSDEELRVACLPVMRRAATTLTEVQTKVDALSAQVEMKASEVARLEEQVSSSAAHNAEVEAQLERAKEELSTLQTQLQEADAVRVGLEDALLETREALQSTKLALSEQTLRTRAAREEAIDQRWTAFIGDAQLALCKDGNRLDRCRDIVGTALVKWEKRYKDCVRSDSAMPELRQLGTRESRPPSFAELLGPDSVTTAGWYILFCDPSLPEARPTQASPAPPGPRSSTGPLPPPPQRMQQANDAQAGRDSQK